MPNNPRYQTAMNQRTHIPQHVEQAINQHMQQSMPAHLKKYVNSDRPTYIPQHAEKQIAQYMDKKMPAHLKSYTGAYMQQRIVQPSTARPNIAQPATPAPHAPVPDPLRRGHSIPYGSQHTVELDTLPEATPLFQADQPATPPEQPAAPAPQGSNYDFITSPEQPKRRLSLPGGDSKLKKVLFAAGGLLVLMIIFVVLKGVLAGSSNLPLFVGIAEDQQELIHLVTNAKQQPDLSSDNQNFVATAQLSLSSSQSDLLKYLAANHKKVVPKQLGLKISTATDEQLTAAASAETYNQTFKDVMKTKLTGYSNNLKQAYRQTTGKKGRAQLSADYDQAQLLLTQLNSTVN
jgi:hypothetical protein